MYIFLQAYYSVDIRLIFHSYNEPIYRSYQEKHLLLTEIQVMKDQLRQWNKEKEKSKLDTATGPKIGKQTRTPT